MIEDSRETRLFPTKEYYEFCDGNRFREDNWDSHEEYEIPRLVAREELHVVSHIHSSKDKG